MAINAKGRAKMVWEKRTKVPNRHRNEPGASAFAVVTCEELVSEILQTIEEREWTFVKLHLKMDEIISSLEADLS